MSDAPRQPQPPPKRDVALALLQESSMFIHLDPRREEVVVPKWFTGQPQLVLQVGLNMAIPIPDLKVDDEGISCTLSFNRAPFWCRIPWSAVYALVGEDGRGGVWAVDVPPEIQQQKQAAPKPAPARKGRPKLTAVGSKSGGSGRGAEGGAKPARRGPTAVPDHAAQRPAASAGPPSDASDDGIGDSEPAEAVRAPPLEAPAEPADERQAAHPSQPPGKKPKREIPPWLRVIK
jgi:hypothetical protein